MFYTLVNGTLDTVNCLPTPQPDISNFGLRYTHYFQAFLSILLSFKKPSHWDMIVNNLVCQSISISLLAAVYFDRGVDVLHSVIASHFVVLMMVCTITTSGFPARESRNRTMLNGLIWVLDTVTKPVMLLYNCGLWVMIKRFQRSDSENPCRRQGAGYFPLFGGLYPLKSPSTAIDLAFAITILQAINYSLQLIAELSRRWKLRNQGPSIQGPTNFDARIWWLWKLHRMKSDTVIWNWDKISKWIHRISLSYKVLTFIYIFMAIEISILANHIPMPHDSDQGWTMTQIFSISTLLLLFGITSHRYNLLSELIRTPLFRRLSSNLPNSFQHLPSHPPLHPIHTAPNPFLRPLKNLFQLVNFTPRHRDFFHLRLERNRCPMYMVLGIYHTKTCGNEIRSIDWDYGMVWGKYCGYGDGFLCLLCYVIFS